MPKEKKPPEFINGTRVRRTRKSSFTFDAGDIYTRVKDFADKWEASRVEERDDRLQREAKFRQWTEGKNWPWPDSSDIKLPDMTTQSLRTQDTLHNAVMSARPPVIARATDKVSKPRAEKVDQVIDHQLFVDMNGEAFISELADAFVNDGHFVAFIPWVREKNQISDVTTFPPLPEGVTPEQFFQTTLTGLYPATVALSVVPKAGLWDYKITLKDDSVIDVAFYTEDDGRVLMVATKFATVFDGPSPRIMDWEKVLYPPRAANLQPPGPSNPKGATAVILVDHPTLDEVTRLQKSGWYDQITAQDIIDLGSSAPLDDQIHQETEKAKDTFSGVDGDQRSVTAGAESHKTLTRYTCFDRFDIDNDGADEDVIWCILRDLPQKVCRATLMSEMYPFQKPKRPLAHSSFIPIRGRVGGISLLELTEGTHDAMKIAYDQMTDATTVMNVPFFFYRASGDMRPEIIELAPGEGYPLGDPSRDVFFPQFNNNSATTGLNTIGLLTNIQEKLTLVGDQALGRVPPGGATALRTVTGMAMLQNNMDARPERIMRRFYMGLRDIYTIVHELNTVFLPKNKAILISKTRSKDEDPYTKIESPDELRGNFMFDFDANAFNTTRQALQEAMTSMMTTYISDINLQTGIIDQDGIYRLQRDWGKIIGQDPDQYLNAPSLGSTLPKIFAEDALILIRQGRQPLGVPAEVGGSAEHLQKLIDFTQTDQFGFIPENFINSLLKPYMEQVAQRAQQEQQAAQQQQAAAAAGEQPAAASTAQPAAPGQNPNDLPEAVQPNQLADQTVPGGNGNGSGENTP